MNKKIKTFIGSLIFFGLFFGALMYFTEAHKNITIATYQGIYYGILMALGEVFIFPKIKSYFENRNKKIK